MKQPENPAPTIDRLLLERAPIVDEIVKRLVQQLDVQTLRGVRDRALLL